MGKRAKMLVATIVVVVAVTGGALAYRSYLGDIIFTESAGHVASTYAQVRKTFRIFTRRNWALLGSWEDVFDYSSRLGDFDRAWDEVKKQQDSWGYADFYLFNQAHDMIAVSGKTTRSTGMGKAFSALFQDGEPVLTSYESSAGHRRVVFAEPLKTPIVANGVTYTGIAVTYDDSAVEALASTSLFNGNSDCYVVDSKGDVVIPLQDRTELTGHIVNLNTYLEKHAEFTHGTLGDFKEHIKDGRSGAQAMRYDGHNYYLVYRAVGIEDWSVVGVVAADAVDAGMSNAAQMTVLVLLVLCAAVVALIVAGLVNYEHGKIRLREHELEAKERERQMAERQKEVTNKLFSGMGKVVDRFAVCDLVSDTYEYFEHQLDEPAYSETGSHQRLIDQIADRFLPLSQGETLKMNQLLDAGRLRDTIKDMDDVQKIEYCGRTENVYRLMNVVPVSFDGEGKVRTVMLITQDIAQRVELENMANTDGLTGLFNERCFAAVLERKEQRHESFMLFYIDLDKFKPVNDTYGHNAGDKLLQAVGKRLKRIVRADDYAFRIGGDEFTMLVSSAASDLQAQRVLERIQEALLEPFVIDEHVIEIGASCGFAHYPGEGSAEEVRILADQRMYECKERNHAER